MSLSETRVDSLALAIANSGAWERMAHFLPLVWLLADGAPVSREQLATVLKRPITEVTEALRQFEDIVYDEESRVVSAGISLQPTPYHFEVNGHLLYTWCALDTLIFPAWTQRPAQVSSARIASSSRHARRLQPGRLRTLMAMCFPLRRLSPSGKSLPG